jgi:hypothetical protein
LAIKGAVKSRELQVALCGEMPCADGSFAQRIKAQRLWMGRRMTLRMRWAIDRDKLSAELRHAEARIRFKVFVMGPENLS